MNSQANTIKGVVKTINKILIESNLNKEILNISMAPPRILTEVWNINRSLEDQSLNISKNQLTYISFILFNNWHQNLGSKF